MKEKRKTQSNPFNQRLLYLIIGMAIVIAVFVAGIIFGGDMNNPPQPTLTATFTAVGREEAIIITETPASADSNTIDLPELQTQWAELEITKTAVNETIPTETPE